jgi:trk system potassium uptake protein TrkH
MRHTKPTPGITQTGKGLWLVYGAVTPICTLAFRFAGMAWLDAVMHAFAAMGLSGFSSHDDSFAFFDSPLIEAITIIFMSIAGINRGSHFVVLRARTCRSSWQPASSRTT